MATARPCLSQLSRLCISPQRTIPTVISSRFLSSSAPFAAAPKILSKAAKAGKLTPKSKKKPAVVKKKKARIDFRDYDRTDAQKYTLCDAMHYLKAFEVGYPLKQAKYELAIRFKTPKNGPVIRNRLRLPNPVRTDIRICVICPPDSKYATMARAAGASLVGEEEVFEAVKEGRIEFDRCVCQVRSLPKLTKSGIARILGPRGLMPSTKMGTVVENPAVVLGDLMGGVEYREKLGTLRLAIGQLGFTPEQMQKNVKVLLESVKRDISQLSEKVNKEMTEVVLSSTHGPGFILNGEFRDLNSPISLRDLSVG